MALTKCKECGGKVSKKAEVCPHCGYKKKKSGGFLQKGLGCLSSIFLIFVMYTCLTSIELPEDDTPWDQKNEYIGAYIMTENWVKERLVSPASAEFPGVSEYQNQVDWYEDQIYEINSYVDSQNRMGAMIRTHFKARVQQVSEDNWELLSLELE